MWEESLIASRPAQPVAQKLFSFPAAILLHGAAFGVAILASWWTIQAVNAPNIARPFYVSPEPPPIRGIFIHRDHPASGRSASAGPIHRVTQENIVPLTNNHNQEQEWNGGDQHGSDFEPVGDPNGVPGGLDIRNLQGLLPTQKDDDDAKIIGPGMSDPVLIKRVEPEYPRAARISRIHGTVVLQAIITRNGDVEIVEVERSDHPLLEKATLDAVRQWKYRPAMLNGRPVKVYFRITVKFTLQ